MTEEHTVRAFTNLDVSGGFQVDWRSGSPSASVTADQNLMGFIELRVSGKNSIPLDGHPLVDSVNGFIQCGRRPHIRDTIIGRVS